MDSDIYIYIYVCMHVYVCKMYRLRNMLRYKYICTCVPACVPACAPVSVTVYVSVCA